MFPKRPFALSNRLKTTPFQKQPRRRGSSSSENWQPEIAPRRGRGPSPVRRCSSGSARASSAAPPEQSPARRDRGQRQRRVKRPASRPASENVPRLGREGDTTCDSVNFIIKAHSGLLQGYRADTERSRDSSPAEPGLSPARGTLASRSFSRPVKSCKLWIAVTSLMAGRFFVREILSKSRTTLRSSGAIWANWIPPRSPPFRWGTRKIQTHQPVYWLHDPWLALVHWALVRLALCVRRPGGGRL